ncbi:MAG: Fe-S-containing protein [Mitsuokella sp.]
MLQTFLQQFIPAMEQAVTLGVPLGVLFAILRRLPFPIYQRNYGTALKWGFWLSIALVAARVGTKNAVSREGVEAGAIAIAVLAEIFCVVFLLKKNDLEKVFSSPFRYSVCIIGLLLFFYHGIEVWLIPAGTLIAAAGEYYTAQVAVKLAGFLAGLLFGTIASVIAYQAAAALNDRRLTFVFVVQAAAMLVQQGIFLIQVMMARQFIGSGTLLSFMAPIIDHSSWLIFIIFFALLFVPLTLFSQKRPTRPVDMNPADFRRMLMKALHKRRWGTATMVVLIAMVLLSSLGSSYANKKEELVAAVNVLAENGSVDVPLTEVNDGHLHRFAYQAANGTKVRYIVILKGGNSYGVGLDACDICGPTGYYEKDGQVICRLCDVMMNKATIGTKGGCNPIPLEHKVEDGKLRVPQEALEKASDVFR